MKRIRIVIDTLMTTTLPLLMAYSLIGEQTHELLGIAMFILFLAHHIINRRWWAGLFKGSYSPARVLNTAVNLALAVFMLSQPIVGILMSKHVLRSVTIDGGSSMLRSIHMTSAYWGFVLLGVHMGLHLRTVGTRLTLPGGNKTPLTAAALAVSAYGVYAFMKRGIGDYLLMRTMFAYFDFSEPVLLFLLDYATVVVLFAVVSCEIMELLNRRKSSGHERRSKA